MQDIINKLPDDTPNYEVEYNANSKLGVLMRYVDAKLKAAGHEEDTGVIGTCAFNLLGSIDGEVEHPFIDGEIVDGQVITIAEARDALKEAGADA